MSQIPVRLQLMSMLLAQAETGVCTCDLAPAVSLSEATVSNHMKVLREAGLVEGTKKGINTYYRPQPAALVALVRVLDLACCTLNTRRAIAFTDRSTGMTATEARAGASWGHDITHN